MNLKCWVERVIEMCTKIITVPKWDNYASSYHSFLLLSHFHTDRIPLAVEEDESLPSVSEEGRVQSAVSY